MTADEKLVNLVEYLENIEDASDEDKTLLEVIRILRGSAEIHWEPAHTYGSENADVYRAYDAGFKDCLGKVHSLIRGQK